MSNILGVCAMHEKFDNFVPAEKSIQTDVLHDSPVSEAWVVRDFCVKNNWFRSTVSQVVPNGIAYYRNYHDSLRDKITHAKIGVFLKGMLSFALTDANIQDLSEQWEVWVKPHPVNITNDPNIIELVVQNGVRTCMRYEGDREYHSPFHPMRILAESDLSLAYIGNPFKPRAFAVVYPAKKLFLKNKLYGNKYSMQKSLELNGYSQTDNPADFDGVKFPRYGYRGTFIMPFIDSHSFARVEQDHIVLCYGDLEKSYERLQTIRERMKEENLISVKSEHGLAFNTENVS